MLTLIKPLLLRETNVRFVYKLFKPTAIVISL